MKCPGCGHTESKVIDSRHVEDSASIRRRRECLSCLRRFNTYEVIDMVQIMVVKKNGEREFFNRNKLVCGLAKACYKRPVSPEAIAQEIEGELQNSLRTEIRADELGEIAMRKLRERDKVAYVRFASVYREFKDVGSFMEELLKLDEPD